MRQPRRRAVSVGPQSVADAYEVLAYQENQARKRRESTPGRSTKTTKYDETISYSREKMSALSSSAPASVAHSPTTFNANKQDMSPIPDPDPDPDLSAFCAVGSPPLDAETLEQKGDINGNSSSTMESSNNSNGRREAEILSRVEKPRVRYDVEVVTKLIVYAGKSYR